MEGDTCSQDPPSTLVVWLSELTPSGHQKKSSMVQPPPKASSNTWHFDKAHLTLVWHHLGRVFGGQQFEVSLLFCCSAVVLRVMAGWNYLEPLLFYCRRKTGAF